ncbi:MAG: nicotinate phosphoribosyltransferase, partial [Pirellula sp.]
MIEYLQGYQFSQADVEYLARIPGNDAKPIFEKDFLRYLEGLKLTVDLDAVPEGTVVFPHQPLLRVSGPILQCQLLETALLNIINFQTLIATKASRVARVAGKDPVLEFGLRRAQGPDGAMSASRAAYIGGCSATSNVLAGKKYGIPVRGTHAHSWVMSFDSELEAFETYASVMPNNCVFLVDTYDTLDGVRNAIEVGKQIASKGYRMVGIRLDSGDLAQLSIAARQMLDQAGFQDASIVASNDLDERLIESLKHQGACIGIWGVGTKLATAYDQAALGGVYKLGAIKDPTGSWQHRIKLSEQMIKTSTPGIQQVRRFYDAQRHALCDMIYDEIMPPGKSSVLITSGAYSPNTDACA